MLLDLIYGDTGCGKTEKCIELIERTIKKNPGHNAILTVPDQYSYTAEKRLVEKMGGTGLNGIEVVTFSQFFRRYIKKDNEYLTSSGKQMLFYLAVSEQENGEQNIFSKSADKPGFVNKVSELVSEMKRYLVTPDMLKDFAGGNDMLSQKLGAFSDIYERYNSLLGEGYKDSDDDFIRFAEFIKSSGEFGNTHIWFDGFSDFLPQHYEVIRAFLSCARSVHVTLCMPEENQDNEIYKTPLSTCIRLKRICEELGARLYEQSCGKLCRTISSPELLFLRDNWSGRKAKYEEKTKDISLFCARDLYSETEYVAKSIINELKNGARYRDIGIMCTDMNGYTHIIEAVFNDFGIPYFTDTEMAVTEHPIILTVLAMFDITESNWSYEAVFRYLRTGFVYKKESNVSAIDGESVDKLENYVLKHGIRGKKIWMSEDDWKEKLEGVFVFSDEEKRQEYEENIDEINNLRRTVVKPFQVFYEKTSGRRTARELATAMFEFLCDIHLYEGITAEINQLNEMGMRDEAERMKEIWNLLMAVINQTVVVCGDELCKKETFRELMRTGLEKASLQIIPSGLDSISISAADRNSSARFRIVFFMGAIQGTMPAEVRNEGILTDTERKKLEAAGLEIAKDAQKKSEQEMFKLYRAVTSASEKLYFSYPTADSEGNAKQPSVFIKDLNKMFPTLTVDDDLIERADEDIFTPKQAFLYVMQAVSEIDNQERARKMTKFYKQFDYFKERLPMVRYAAEYKKEQPEITRENAKKLYHDYHRYSVSRLNDYSACPFGYFVKHGLKAKEQEIWRIQKFEIGSLLHWAVCEYCREVEDGAENIREVAEKWRELSDEESLEIVEKIMEDISSRTMARLSRNRGQVEYLLERMKKILLRSVSTVRMSLVRGDYSAICYEKDFRIDIEWKGRTVGLNGTIDRVDAMQDIEGGKIYLRVIDYKSGSKDFSVADISNNTDMQLVVYAIAATELYKKGALGRAEQGLEPDVSGILYNKLRNDMITCDVNDKDAAEAKIKNSMKLNGLIIADSDNGAEVALSMDRTMPQTSDKSEFLKLGLNKSGGINKLVSKTASKEEFEILTKYVRKTAVRIDGEIFGGNIKIQPAKNQTGMSCKFCKYKEICLYDMRTDGIRKAIGAKEAMDYMKNEVKENEGDAEEKLDG